MKLPQLPRRRLRFECTRCGACCRRPGVVYLAADEPARLAAFLGLGLAQFRSRYLSELPDGEGWVIEVEGDAGCPLLDGDLCSVEAVKPGQCRAYPFWSELVDNRPAWRREAALCEGIGKGPVIPSDEVKRLRALDPGS